MPFMLLGKDRIASAQGKNSLNKKREGTGKYKDFERFL